MGTGTRLYFASDIHGSETCFRKFLNAGKFYEADTLILGGDITGKSIVFISEEARGLYSCKYMGKLLEFSRGPELDDFIRIIKGCGHYPYVASREENSALSSDPAKMNQLFARTSYALVTEWLELAESRLRGSGIRCLMMIGNDDLPEIAELIDGSGYIINPEGKAIDLDDWHRMVSIGWSSPTPWATPHECAEEELAQKIDAMMEKVPDPNACVLCAHAPPFGSGLDDAPRITGAMQIETSMGQPVFAPAGSTAVLDAILKYGFILSLHGHIHEARASKRIGPTLCINPGSDYSDGTLHGALVTFKKHKLASYQLVSG